MSKAAGGGNDPPLPRVRPLRAVHLDRWPGDCPVYDIRAARAVSWLPKGPTVASSINNT